MIQSYLQYAISIWGGTYRTYIQPIITLQKRALRLITDSPYLAHTDPLFSSCKIMKFDQIYHYRLCLYLFARKDNILFQRDHTHSTRFRDDLLAPYHRLSQGQHSTFYQAITYWNTLPINIRRSPRLVSFRNSLKFHIFST